ncbi:MAG TPA: hypothetical protein VFH77_07975 [Streptomyces sp.]|nr:hypothetical protein [Streptomyces sp.]
MDFRQAFNTVAAELTPQPWEYTSGEGATLTVIPEGLTAEPGDAEVIVRVTVDKTQAAEAGVTTTDLPALIDAIEQHTAWMHTTLTGDRIEITQPAVGELRLSVTELHGRRETEAHLMVPARQWWPLGSALRRALDVARGWER